MLFSLPDLSFVDLEATLGDWGLPAYRARQVWDWAYVHLIDDFQQMSNLPGPLRDRLTATFCLDPLTPVATETADGRLTTKTLFALPPLEGGDRIEAVLMRYPAIGRNTVCVSTQAGCAVGCAFCATGQMGFRRNLSAGEIAAQVLHFARQLKPREQAVTHVVLMGMGEPLSNYDASLAAIRRLHDPAGFNLGARHFTISTVGVVPGIRRLAGEDLQVNLAVSLHAPDDTLRDELVPINRRYPLADLLAAVREYIDRTHRRVTFEYALVAGVNDGETQARALVARLRGLLAHVNLIPLNPVPGLDLRPSPAEQVRAFQQVLEDAHIPVTLRDSRGASIQAGCGQLQAQTS
ncbi:MAG: 23S rRNA (adenine(2503)-C(2))-methyltransferase RlmN [Chloroflexi bacterium]|nr:23S rRNA (adenine(2503)-C(2))-methyltransferase RlmN [Chloroflexota bacterium]MBU1750770.1 23S rRNA (adenine(2503)-C(2))-methyltransferase RlmN [Chloroflexota bacterium]